MKQLVGACLVCLSLLTYAVISMLAQISHSILTVSKIAIGGWFNNITFSANAAVVVVILIGLYFWCSKEK